MPKLDAPKRYLTQADEDAPRPVHVVWELTLACDLKCSHCGSRAGRKRHDELTTGEALDLVGQLALLGTREVTLIGGEAYLRADWLQIIREIRRLGMDCSLQSGGFHLTEARIREAGEAGLTSAGISIDGLEELHDRLRGVPGSFRAAVSALAALRTHGITSSVNTQITAAVLPQLRRLMETVADGGARNWQIQLTVPMGRAAEHSEMLLQPFQMLELMPLLADLQDQAGRRGVLLQIGNNVGYFGPYESRLRGSGDEAVHWCGCYAGRSGLGLEADGTIKGCPSLPTQAYAAGNVRSRSIAEAWRSASQLAFERPGSAVQLWGYCQTCYYAAACRGGCSWMAHSLFGRRGNNPYCHHRALELNRQGLRERVVQIAPSPGTPSPFDHGIFSLQLEDHAGRKVSGASADLVQITDKAGEFAIPDAGDGKLFPCPGCRRHVFKGTKRCPHCGQDVRSLSLDRRRDLQLAHAAADRLNQLMSGIGTQ